STMHIPLTCCFILTANPSSDILVILISSLLPTMSKTLISVGCLSIPDPDILNILSMTGLGDIVNTCSPSENSCKEEGMESWGLLALFLSVAIPKLLQNKGSSILVESVHKSSNAPVSG